ncbi:MAG: hypothetical protein MPJ50_15440 [Pirellulales bacterium]|nr:hypothetical protein [Pirellulales bacterium]
MSEPSLKNWAKVQAPSRSATQQDGDERDYQAFSFGRVSSRLQPMIEFVKADGYRLTLSYMDLKSIATNDPSFGFELSFVHQTICIEGRHLETCYRYLQRNRVESVQEVNRAQAMEGDNEQGMVTNMKIKQNGRSQADAH